MNALSHALLPQCGCTSLILAALWGHVEVASLLLQRGADIETKDEVRISLLGFFLVFKVLLHFLSLSVYLFLSLSSSFAVSFSLPLFFFFFCVSCSIPDRKFLFL
jgi:hypothetical protein